MPRFRKKPIVIRAEKLTDENGEQLADWCGGSFNRTIKFGYASSGDKVCNNYCNQAPQKGPMVDVPPVGPDATLR